MGRCKSQYDDLTAARFKAAMTTLMKLAKISKKAVDLPVFATSDGTKHVVLLSIFALMLDPEGHLLFRLGTHDNQTPAPGSTLSICQNGAHEYENLAFLPDVEVAELLLEYGAWSVKQLACTAMPGARGPDGRVPAVLQVDKALNANACHKIAKHFELYNLCHKCSGQVFGRLSFSGHANVTRCPSKKVSEVERPEKVRARAEADKALDQVLRAAKRVNLSAPARCRNAANRKPRTVARPLDAADKGKRDDVGGLFISVCRVFARFCLNTSVSPRDTKEIPNMHKENQAPLC